MKKVVALSTAEAEYIAAELCSTEVLYLQRLVSDFTGNDMQAILHNNMDNQSEIAKIKNYEITKLSRHKSILLRTLLVKLIQAYVCPVK